MLTSEDLYGITFLVGENEAMVRAHRYVLMSRSCVFHAMLRGPLAEREAVRVPDVPEVLFRDFLRFLYTDSVDVTPDNVTALLYLGKKYAVGSLEKLCLAKLESSLSADTACTILEQAHRFEEEDLMSKALPVMVEHSEVTLMSDDFLELCRSCVCQPIQSQDITADPELIFTAVLYWASKECNRQKREITPENKRKALGDIIFHIGFPSMDQQTFARHVVLTKILSDEEHTKIFCHLVTQETEIEPFKTRKKSHNQSKVLFYKSQAQAPEGTKMEECVSISCNRDISIKGMLVHSSKRKQTSNYVVYFWKKGCSGSTVPNGKVVFIERMRLDEIIFDKAIMIKAGEIYEFRLYPVGDNQNNPSIVGQPLGEVIQSSYKEEPIRFNMKHLMGTVGVIAGLKLAIGANE